MRQVVTTYSQVQISPIWLMTMIALAIFNDLALSIAFQVQAAKHENEENK